jgi:hypothetical protein
MSAETLGPSATDERDREERNERDDVSIVGHDPATGLPTVHVESDRPAARAWLEALYEQCKAAATAVA